MSATLNPFENLPVTLICPVSGKRDWRLLVSTDHLRKETLLRKKFLVNRLPPKVLHRELKHQHEFSIPAQGAIFENSHSGVLVRVGLPGDIQAIFRQESYSRDLLESLFQRFLRSFRRRIQPYQCYLNPGSRVV